MFTSYYFSPKIDPAAMDLVAISRSVPGYMKNKVRVYGPLCPQWSLVMAYKDKRISDPEYVREYAESVLHKLDPAAVYRELGPNAVLLCWERPESFCHRHLVAKWLSGHLGIEIPEL